MKAPADNRHVIDLLALPANAYPNVFIPGLPGLFGHDPAVWHGQ